MKLSHRLILPLCLVCWISPAARACPTVAPGAALEMPAVAPIATAVHARLSASEVEAALVGLPGWKQVGEVLLYEQRFEDFVAAIAFVNRLVEPAESLGHHPEITVNYNLVTLRLTTHDAGGLTELDFQLAQQINQMVLAADD